MPKNSVITGSLPNDKKDQGDKGLVKVLSFTKVEKNTL